MNRKGITFNTGRTHFKKGTHPSPKTEFKKGIVPWNKGKKLPFIPHPKALGRKVWNLGIVVKELQGTKHPLWKGDKASYSSVHKWVVRHKGRPQKCTICRTTELRRYEWANIDHKYKRNLNDYLRMCKKCHKRYDIKNGI